MNGGPQSNVSTSFQDFMTDLFYFPLLFVFDDLLFYYWFVIIGTVKQTALRNLLVSSLNSSRSSAGGKITFFTVSNVHAILFK